MHEIHFNTDLDRAPENTLLVLITCDPTQKGSLNMTVISLELGYHNADEVFLAKDQDVEFRTGAVLGWYLAKDFLPDLSEEL